MNTVSTSFFIHQNFILESLIGLDNISTIGVDLWIYQNFQLTDCSIQSICEYMAAPNGEIYIYSNSTGCNSPEQLVADCNCPFGDVIFATQAEVDGFLVDYPTCTEIEGNLSISGADITDLSALSNLTAIGGDLTVGAVGLSNFTGLDNLTSIGGGLFTTSNPVLTSMTGLGSVDSIGSSFFIISNEMLQTTSGMSNLESIKGELYLINNQALTDLSGFAGINLLGFTGLIIENNGSLQSLSGFENLDSISGGLSIVQNS